MSSVCPFLPFMQSSLNDLKSIRRHTEASVTHWIKLCNTKSGLKFEEWQRKNEPCAKICQLVEKDEERKTSKNQHTEICDIFRRSSKCEHLQLFVSEHSSLVTRLIHALLQKKIIIYVASSATWVCFYQFYFSSLHSVHSFGFRYFILFLFRFFLFLVRMNSILLHDQLWKQCKIVLAFLCISFSFQNMTRCYFCFHNFNLRRRKNE